MSAVISEPDRSAASTTTTICAERRDDPVARRERPSDTASRPAGARRSRPRARRAARAGRGGCAGTATSGPQASTAIVFAAASSAPSWAAESMPSAMPLTTVTPGGREPAAEQPRAVTSLRRGLARADDRRPPAPASSSASRCGSPAQVQDGGSVGQLEQARRVARRRAGRSRASRPRPSAARSSSGSPPRARRRSRRPAARRARR